MNPQGRGRVAAEPGGVGVCSSWAGVLQFLLLLTPWGSAAMSTEGSALPLPLPVSVTPPSPSCFAFREHVLAAPSPAAGKALHVRWTRCALLARFPGRLGRLPTR